MKGPGPYTVFAPTDEAFAKVPKDVLEGLGKDKAKLQEVLKYHVLTSKWTTDDIKLVKQTGTAQGKPVTFGMSGGVLTVNGAKVIKPNIDCANGMVHAIEPCSCRRSRRSPPSECRTISPRTRRPRPSGHRAERRRGGHPGAGLDLQRLAEERQEPAFAGLGSGDADADACFRRLNRVLFGDQALEVGEEDVELAVHSRDLGRNRRGRFDANA